MRMMMTGVLTAAALAIAAPALAQGVYVEHPDVTVGAGPHDYDHYRDDDNDYDRNRDVHQEYNYDDGDCRVHVEREYHADGNYDEHRSRDCDDD